NNRSRIRFIKEHTVSPSPNEIKKAKLDKMLVNANRPRVAALGAAVRWRDKHVRDAVSHQQMATAELCHLRDPQACIGQYPRHPEQGTPVWLRQGFGRAVESRL